MMQRKRTALIRWCLRIVVVLQTAGIVARSWAGDAPIVSLLWSPADTGGFGWSEPAAKSVEQVARIALLIAIGLILWRPCWPVLLPLALWNLALVAVDSWLGGKFPEQIGLPWLEIPAHAVRIAAPIALWLFDPWPRQEEISPRRAKRAEALVRWAVAATFVAHGWEAHQHHPDFIDYLISAANHLAAVDLAESAARRTLSMIGVLDFFLAALIVLVRWRYVALYMAAWGAITAGSRIVHAGWPAYFDVLLRAANAGLPLVLAIYWWSARPSGNAEFSKTETSDDS